MAESRLLELEITSGMFGSIFSDEQQARLEKQIEELRSLTSSQAPNLTVERGRRKSAAPLTLTLDRTTEWSGKRNALSTVLCSFHLLSSPVKGLRDFRRDLHHLASSGERHIWVDEVCDERDVDGEEHLPNMDKLLDTISSSTIYVALLAAPHRGTPIRIDGRESNVSFFEIELFRAALLNKPLLVLIHCDFVPDTELSRLLQLILPVLPPSSIRTKQTDASIRTTLQDLLSGIMPVTSKATNVPLVTRLGQRLFDRRGRFASQAFGARPLLLLNHTFPAERTPDVQVITSALASEAVQSDGQRRLSRLWIALRELFGAPFWQPAGEPFVRHWNEALKAWNSTTAWYGLHAHIWLGSLAGANSLARLRQIACARAGVDKDDPEFRHPGRACKCMVLDVEAFAMAVG